MGSFILKLYEHLDKGEYYKFLDITQFIFNLIAPSYSYIFLYERHLFKELNTIQLIILCLILNALLFFYIRIMVIDKIDLRNSLKNIDKKLNTIEYDANFETQVIITFFCSYIWLNYFLCIILYKVSNLNIVSSITIIIILICITLYILEGLYIAIKLKKRAKIIHYIMMTTIVSIITITNILL